MGHLTPDQLIDLSEGAQPESSLPHLQECDRCRRHLADLRATMAVVATAKAPEPSPLFWDPFATRVRTAIEFERERATSIAGRLRSAAAALASWPNLRPIQLAAVAVLITAVGLVVTRNRPPVSPTSALLTGADGVDFSPATDDASLALVADLAAGLDWEAAAEAGLTTHVGVDDDLVNQLTEAERQELHQLLQGELSPSRRGA